MKKTDGKDKKILWVDLNVGNAVVALVSLGYMQFAVRLLEELNESNVKSVIGAIIERDGSKNTLKNKDFLRHVTQSGNVSVFHKLMESSEWFLMTKNEGLPLTQGIKDEIIKRGNASYHGLNMLCRVKSTGSAKLLLKSTGSECTVLDIFFIKITNRILNFYDKICGHLFFKIVSF